jgi:ribulose-5-phosphate 4-epimerase/fuculose-1-phosphate aldolase
MALSMVPGGLVAHHPTRHAPGGGRLGRHAYEGLALTADEGERLVRNLGANDGLILENHGTLTVGATVAEAYMLMHHLERAAQAQLRAMAACAGRAEVLQAGPATADRTLSQWLGDGSERDGDSEWPALRRRLDKMDRSYQR